jgi:hypothetical protein
MLVKLTPARVSLYNQFATFKNTSKNLALLYCKSNSEVICQHLRRLKNRSGGNPIKEILSQKRLK